MKNSQEGTCMRNMYEVGKVYVWQNCFRFPEFNGRECTVLGNIMPYTSEGVTVLVQRTDSTHTLSKGVAFAQSGQLRPKHPPSGEKGISDMFKLPQVISKPVVAGKVVEELEGFV